MGWPGSWSATRSGAPCSGPLPGQTVVADSTTVLFYKLVRAAVDAGPGRPRRDRLRHRQLPHRPLRPRGRGRRAGLTLRWIETDPRPGMTLEQVGAVGGPADRAGGVQPRGLPVGAHLADAPGITAGGRTRPGASCCGTCGTRGARWRWRWTAGGRTSPWAAATSTSAAGPARRPWPTSPGATRGLRQPIQGWIGQARPLPHGAGYTPAPGIRSLSQRDAPDPRHGAAAWRPRPGRGGRLWRRSARRRWSWPSSSWSSPTSCSRAPGSRWPGPAIPPTAAATSPCGATISASITERLWAEGVIPDYRAPDGIRIGLAPLSTSFAEVLDGVLALRRLAAERRCTMSGSNDIHPRRRGRWWSPTSATR